MKPFRSSSAFLPDARSPVKLIQAFFPLAASFTPEPSTLRPPAHLNPPGQNCRRWREPQGCWLAGELKPSGYGRAPGFLVAYWRVTAIGQVRKSIGANIRTFRKKSGLSQESLAEKAELHPVYISQVERGTKAVSVDALWKLSRVLHVSMSALFRGI